MKLHYDFNTENQQDIIELRHQTGDKNYWISSSVPRACGTRYMVDIVNDLFERMEKKIEGSN